MIRSVQGRRVLAISLCLLVLQGTGLPGLATVARAEGPPEPRTLVLLPFAGPSVSEAVPERLWSQLESALAESASAHVRPPATPKAGSEHPAHALWMRGEALLARGRHAAAAAVLEQGVEAAFANPSGLDHARLHASLLLLGSAQLRGGNEEKARATLMHLVRLAPAYQLPHARFPPAFIRELERARTSVEALPRAELVVEGPEGATVHVDGTRVGSAPASLTLPVGLHLLVLENSEGARWGRTVDIQAPRLRLSGLFPPSPPDPRASLGPSFGPADADVLDIRAEKSGAGAVLVWALEGKGDAFLLIESALYLTESRGFVRLPRMETNGSGDLSLADIERLRAALRQVRSARPPASLPFRLLDAGTTPARSLSPRIGEVDGSQALREHVHVSRPPSGTPVLDGKKTRLPWWVWTLGGVGLAAAAAGTYYGLSQKEKPVQGAVGVTW